MSSGIAAALSLGELRVDQPCGVFGTAGEKYSAQYMEAVFTPGMKGATHMHPGPEAWYTLSGETCLETPEGAQVGRAGGPPVIVRANLPMQPVATGHETRRAEVLILHERSK